MEREERQRGRKEGGGGGERGREDSGNVKDNEKRIG